MNVVNLEAPAEAIVFYCRWKKERVGLRDDSGRQKARVKSPAPGYNGRNRVLRPVLAFEEVEHELP